MKNRYEALLVLNTQGREDTVKDIVDRLESEFQKEGADIEQVQKMDKRHFSYVAGPLDSGFYVNFVFQAEPQLITKLRSKLNLIRKFIVRITNASRKKRRSRRKSWLRRNSLVITWAWPASTKSYCSEILRAIRRCVTRRKEARYAISASQLIAFTRPTPGRSARKLLMSMLCFGRAWLRSPVNT